MKVLAGSYDFYDSEDERKAINASLVPVFRDKLFQGGQFAEKFQLLAHRREGPALRDVLPRPALEQAFHDAASRAT